MANSLTPRLEQAAAKRRSLGELPKTPQSEVSLKIRESTNELQNFLVQWNKHHMTGGAVLSSIKTLKLEAMSRSESDSFYPVGLQERCHELQKVLDRMESCIRVFTLLVQQFDALVELDVLQGGTTRPVGISWTSEKFRNSYKDILSAYSNELSLKTTIKEEIAHCSRKESLVAYITSWTLQPFITKSCGLLCESIFLETGVR